MAKALKVRPDVSPGAIRILRSVPGVDAVLVDENGRSAALVEFKARVTAPDARVLAGRLTGRRGPAIVVAKETTGRARATLQDVGIGVVDAAGNAHLDLPGLIVHIEAPSASSRRPREGIRIGGKAGVVVQALLLEPARKWKLGDLARRAEVSVGSAHHVVAFLEQRELLGSEGSGPQRRRRVLDPGALLDFFAEELRDRGVEQLHAYRFEQVAERLPRATSRVLQRREIAHAVSGAAAANILAPFLTVVPITAIWIAADIPLDQAAEAIGAEPGSRGANLMLMQAGDGAPLAFAEKRDDVLVANVFRVYVDAGRDPQRGAEQAEHFRREVIGF